MDEAPALPFAAPRWRLRLHVALGSAVATFAPVLAYHPAQENLGDRGREFYSFGTPLGPELSFQVRYAVSLYGIGLLVLQLLLWTAVGMFIAHLARGFLRRSPHSFADPRVNHCLALGFIPAAWLASVGHVSPYASLPVKIVLGSLLFPLRVLSLGMTHNRGTFAVAVIVLTAVYTAALYTVVRYRSRPRAPAAG